MKASLFGLILVISAVCAFSCQPQPTSLTEAQKVAIADSAKAVVQLMLSYADKLEFGPYFSVYSTDADVRCIENGSLYPSLDSMKSTYMQMQLLVESPSNTPDAWNMTVLGTDAVSITMPFHFTFKPKGLPEYKGQGVWSGIVQRRGGKWRIIQSHESWVNPEQAMAAFVPPPAKQSRPKK
jgi:hypothetical protein